MATSVERDDEATPGLRADDAASAALPESGGGTG